MIMSPRSRIGLFVPTIRDAEASKWDESLSTSPNRLENLHTLRMANADAGFATGFGTLVTGTFLAGFIASIGGSDYWINLLAGVPSLLGLMQIPGAIWGRRHKSFKKFVAPGGLIWRLLYLPLIPLPFLPIPGELKLWILLICVSLASASVLIVQPVYSDWLAELVPVRSRGFFFSRRNAIAVGVGSVVGLIGAMILDAFKKAGAESYGFSAIFGLAGACGLISFWFFMRMHDTEREVVVRQTVKQGIKGLATPFVETNFRKVLIFLGLFILGQAFAGNLFAAFAIKSLELPYTIIQWAAVFHAFGHVVAARFFGFLADKYGNKPILMISGFGLTLTPASWLFCVPGDTMRNALILLPSHILVGATWAGVSLCQFNLLLATAKQEDRANYLSVGLTVQAIMGFIAPLLGAQMLVMLNAAGSLSQADAYKAVFIATMGIRFISVFFLAPVREEGALRIRQALRDLSRVSPRGFMAMKELSRSADDVTREAALESVAEKGFSLASDEVIKALHDPSPKVRRQAALAIARLRDPAGVEALIHQLVDHPDLAEEETVEALGMLAHPRALPVLITMLQSPRAILRRASAKALARIGHPASIEPLTQAASEQNDPDLRRAALQALRSLGAVDSWPAIADALLDPAPSVRIAAAEAVSELAIVQALPQLRRSIEEFQDEAASEAAYALGVVGTDEDIAVILKEASQCLSITTRRRCLLGVARRLGVEGQVYKLLLAEGMARDTELMTTVKAASRGSKRFREALRLYSAGDEPAALRELSTIRRIPQLAVLAEHPVEEAFLVAACAMAAMPPRGRA